MTNSPTALNLPMASPLPEATQKYFDICQDKLGMIPNVLQAYAFDIDKLNAFTALYNDVMLADSGLGARSSAPTGLLAQNIRTYTRSCIGV